jgi:hypothetical protein
MAPSSHKSGGSETSHQAGLLRAPAVSCYNKSTKEGNTMCKRLIAAIAILVAVSSATAEGAHFLSSQAWGNSSVAPATVYARVEQAASAIAGHGQPARIALFDMAFPADAAEYRTLGGYGLVLVVALSHVKEELPPLRVYLRIAAATIDLQQVASVCSMSPAGSEVATVLGDYLCESLYMFPVYTRLQDADLMLDFAKNRDGFVLGHFSATDAVPLTDLPIAPKTGPMPQERDLLTFASREFPGFISTSTASKR